MADKVEDVLYQHHSIGFRRIAVADANGRILLIQLLDYLSKDLDKSATMTF